MSFITDIFKPDIIKEIFTIRTGWPRVPDDDDDD